MIRSNMGVWGRIALASGAMGALASAPLPAWAAGEAVTGSLEEVVITAQRRSENVQHVAIAVTALEAGDLAGKAVISLADLQYASPSLSVGNSGLTNAVNIRGVGLASGNPNVGNGVATYVDGVFQPPIVSTNQFYDIADVEILRGPQGTLVGSNSTGGAIIINTQSPKLSTQEGYIRVGAGNYDLGSAEGAVNIPLGDVLALRAAGEYTSRGSFYSSVGPLPTTAGSLHEKSGRLGLLLKPGAFQALAKIEYTDRDTGGYAATPVPGTQYYPYAPSDPFKLAYDTPNQNHERGLLGTLELRYELANGLTLRSLTGYQDKNIHNIEDYDGTAETIRAPQITWNQRVREREWTEEVNLLSPKTEIYDWVIGAYYQKNKIDVNIDETVFTIPPTPLFLFIPQDKTTTGFFGQLNFHLTPQWELQTGLRYSTFKVKGNGFISLNLPAPVCGFLGIPLAPFNGCQVGDASGAESDGRVTGKVSLNYSLDSHNLFYGFVARGYKPGGFNSTVDNFEPETVMDYELGWKSTQVDGHLRTQLGGFYYAYHGFQFETLDLTNGTTGVRNLPMATIYGIEASGQAQISGWELDAGLSYVHSKQPSAGPFVNQHLLPPNAAGGQCAVGQTSGCFDYTPYLQTGSGGSNLYSPEWNLNAGIAYRVSASEEISITPRLNYAYVSGQYTSLTYSTTTDYLPSHGLLSALVTMNVRDHWTIEAYGTNLADTRYRSGQGLNNGNYYFYGAPRQLGLRLEYRY